MRLSGANATDTTANPPEESHGSEPRVTVVLPVYNRTQFFAQAIHSVLNQSYHHIQLIVVDDGSSLDLRPAVAPFGGAVEFYRKAQGGPASARNYGLKRAKGDFLLFLDDDDFLEPTAVEALLTAVNQVPGLAWAAGRLAYVDAQGRYLPKIHPCTFASGDVYAAMIQDNLIGTPSSVLLRTAVVRSLGGFDESPIYQLCEDYGLWLTLARDFPIAAIPDVVSNYRYHAGNATRQWARHYRAWLAILEKHRLQARPGCDALFQSAMARVHLQFGDEEYVNGRHAEARRQWREAYQADPHLRQGSKLLRYAKSYLPAPMLRALRAWQKRLAGALGRSPAGDLVDWAHSERSTQPCLRSPESKHEHTT